MRNIILFDDSVRENFLPLTFTRPVAEIRIGILTIREKWELVLEGKASYITQDYLSDKYDINIEEDNFVINGSVLPSPQLKRLILQLEPNQALLENGELIATRLSRKQFHFLMEEEEIEELQGFELADTEYQRIQNTWEIFSKNHDALLEDFERITSGRTSQQLSDSNKVFGSHPVFLEEGAIVENASLNTTKGPIYIGKNAEIMEGALVRGPLAMCENSVLKLGAKVYGATTLGPYCKMGGEISNIVAFGYSSKGHDGYLGNAVLGEWCNLGADTNSSNLKNNYADVRLWNYPSERFLNTGLTFCGLIMGDHSKCGINSMFNTGTVVGVFANIFGSGFPRNFVPSFAWGGNGGYSTYKFSKACEVAEKVMARRNTEFNDQDKAILQNVFEQTTNFRRWDKTSDD